MKLLHEIGGETTLMVISILISVIKIGLLDQW